jgi:hypothetical protein
MIWIGFNRVIKSFKICLKIAYSGKFKTDINLIKYVIIARTEKSGQSGDFIEEGFYHLLQGAAR